MKKTKLWLISLPALLTSAFVFETMPSSVRQFVDGKLTDVAYNFFNLESAHRAASLLPLAGGLTIIALGFALMAAFLKSKTKTALKMVCWISLAAATLTAMPYMLPTEGIALQPNVIVTILLFAVWYIAWLLDRKIETPEEKNEKKTKKLKK